MSVSGNRATAKPNIRDIAKLAGVAPATVSRVMNGKTRHKTEITEKVTRIIRQAGYVRKKSCPITGTILSLNRGSKSKTEHSVKCVNYLNEICKKSGLKLLDLTITDIVKLDHVIKDNNIIGIIDFCRDISREQVNIPLVKINSNPVYLSSSAVDCDDSSGIVDSLVYLKAQGHRRIAYFDDHALISADRRCRMLNLPAIYQYAGVEYHPELTWQQDFNSRTHHQVIANAIDHFFQAPQPPTAIVLIGDVYASSVYGLLNERGLKVPEDISIVGFDDSIEATMVYPQLTTVREPFNKMVKIALNLLLEQIKRGSQPPVHIMVKPQLIVRDSVKNLKPG